MLELEATHHLWKGPAVLLTSALVILNAKLKPKGQETNAFSHCRLKYSLAGKTTPTPKQITLLLGLSKHYIKYLLEILLMLTLFLC